MSEKRKIFGFDAADFCFFSGVFIILLTAAMCAILVAMQPSPWRHDPYVECLNAVLPRGSIVDADTMCAHLRSKP